jgi:hypothetical protein
MSAPSNAARSSGFMSAARSIKFLTRAELLVEVQRDFAVRVGRERFALGAQLFALAPRTRKTRR